MNTLALAALVERQAALIRTLVDKLAQHEAVSAWAEEVKRAEREREELLP